MIFQKSPNDLPPKPRPPNTVARPPRIAERSLPTATKGQWTKAGEASWARADRKLLLGRPCAIPNAKSRVRRTYPPTKDCSGGQRPAREMKSSPLRLDWRAKKYFNRGRSRQQRSDVHCAGPQSLKPFGANLGRETGTEKSILINP